MENSARVDLHFIGAIRRRTPVSSLVFLLLFIITAGLALGLPSYFRSRAVILIEAQEMPQDLVRSLVTSFADQRIQVISQRVLTSTNLGSVIEKFDLYKDERRHDPLEIVIERMRKDISVNPISADVADPRAGRSIQATIAFELAYESESAALAQRVANELVSLFLSENLRQRTATSEETLKFLSEESGKLRKQVTDLEQSLADFKEAHVHELPEIANINLELMNRTESEIQALDGQIRSLEQQRIYLESELSQQKPNLGVFSETGERILGPADRLKVLESEFTPLAARYGNQHPDVVAKRKEIESLRKQVGGGSDTAELRTRLTAVQTELGVVEEKYSSDHPDVRALKREAEALRTEISRAANSGDVVAPSPRERPDNPAFIQLQTRLEGTMTDLAGLRSQRASLSAKLQELEKRVSIAPEVERQYRGLTRDYETAQRKYDEITAKRQEAEVASNLESEQKGERFTLIEPPIVPERPSKPNRLAIAFVGSLMSIAAAVAVGFGLEAIDDRIYGRSSVLRVVGVPPLAVIPRMENDVIRRRKTKRRVLIGLGAVILLCVVAACIHFFFRPLDVLYFQSVRVLGF